MLPIPFLNTTLTIQIQEWNSSDGPTPSFWWIGSNYPSLSLLDNNQIMKQNWSIGSFFNLVRTDAGSDSIHVFAVNGDDGTTSNLFRYSHNNPTKRQYEFLYNFSGVTTPPVYLQSNAYSNLDAQPAGSPYHRALGTASSATQSFVWSSKVTLNTPTQTLKRNTTTQTSTSTGNGGGLISDGSRSTVFYGGGSGGSNQFFAIKEILIFFSHLSGTDETNIINYLKSKYNIP
jgi:hypothetical protein